VENDSCAVDAVQVMTGCTFGKGNLIFRDYGKQAYTFMSRATGKALEPALERSIGLVEDPAQGASGPLWVRGGIPVTGADGHAYEVRNRMALCRCGLSSNKPFCDGTHVSAHWKDGIEEG
jgi:hypothetical protein